MSEYIKTDDKYLKELADFVRSKTGTTELMTPDEIALKIQEIKADSDSTFKGTTYLPDGTTVYSGAFIIPKPKYASKVVLQEGVEELHTEALKYAGAYTGTDRLVLPSTVKTLYDAACLYSYYNSIIVNENCGLYGDCFGRMSKLTKVWLPASCQIVTTTNNYTFYKCPKTVVIYTDAESRPNEWSTYFNCYDSSTALRLTVHYGSTIEDFEAA